MTPPAGSGTLGPVTADAHYPGHLRPAPVSRGARPSLPVFLVVVALLALAGCGSTPERRAGTAAAAPIRIVDVVPDDPMRANDVLMRAIGLVGTPYRYGGNTPAGGFDCSGLVGYVYRTTLGIELPRVSRDMARSGEKVDRGDMSPGDLVFFGRRGKVDHVGIYLGEGRFVHAPRTGRDVTVSTMQGGYWGNKFLEARRVAGI